MKVLRLLWRILVVLFQEIRILWKKYQAYRALKAQPQDLSDDPHRTVAPPSPSASEPVARESTDQPISLSSQERESSEETEATVQTEIPLIPPSSPEPPERRWIPPSAPVTVQGIVIADGFIYVGRRPPHLTAEDCPELIDPSLSIKTAIATPNSASQGMDWPQDAPLSYAALSPEMRGVFLGWLATGRRDRDIPDSALRLFLFGLECRILELLTGERTVDELLALILELERLEVHYAHYATLVPIIQHLIECCQVQLALSCQPETLLALLPVQKLSTALKVALGRCIEQAKPIPMAMLWAWYQSSTVAVDLKTPAKRCEREFNVLLQTRGEQRDFKITAGEDPSMLQVQYHPFSLSFGESPSPISIAHTIDIAELEPQLTVVESLVQDCTDDLDAYSRLIGRSPESEGTPAAVALLPQELVVLCGNDQVKAIQDWCHQVLGAEDSVSCPGEDLLKRWPTATPGKIRKKEAESLAILLAKLGFGYVPDVRYGQTTFNPKHAVVLFRLERLGPEPLSADYPMALILTELQPFFDRVAENQVSSTPLAVNCDLTVSERSRLIAVERWRRERPLTWKQACTRVKKLSDEQKARLATALSLDLTQDWQLAEDQYQDLQALIPLPPREPAELAVESEDKSQLKTPDPVVEIKSTDATVDAVQDPEPIEQAPVFVLDERLIAQRSQESQVASGLLSDIFEEDEPIIATSVADSGPVASTLPEATSASPAEKSLALGLDEFHWFLLRELGQKDSWERSELEAIAQDQGLLLDGALENINDVAFDYCDEALTEGEDPIEVNDWVFEELQAA